MITHNEYMKDSANLHHDFYAQFITSATEHFIRTRITIDKLKKSNCPHFNDIIKHNSGDGWLWGNTPFNATLAKETGMTNVNTSSVSTCVGKACARILLQRENDTNAKA